MKKLINWLKKIFGCAKPSSNTKEGPCKSTLVESKEREDELWEMAQKNPELFDYDEYIDRTRSLTYKETGEYFIY